MKALVKPAFLVCLLLLLSPGSAIAGKGELKPYRGDLRQPTIELTDMQGKTHRLEQYRGNIVLVQFWATYCTPCRTEMPTMNRLIEKMRDQPFQILTVNMAESRAQVQAFIDEVPVDFPVLLDADGATLGRWKVFAAPANFLLDKRGRITHTLYGAIEWDSAEMVSRLTELAQAD